MSPFFLLFGFANSVPTTATSSSVVWKKKQLQKSTFISFLGLPCCLNKTSFFNPWQHYNQTEWIHFKERGHLCLWDSCQKFAKVKTFCRLLHGYYLTTGLSPDRYHLKVLVLWTFDQVQFDRLHAVSSLIPLLGSYKLACRCGLGARKGAPLSSCGVLECKRLHIKVKRSFPRAKKWHFYWESKNFKVAGE